MTVFIIGVVTVTALLWILTASLANESDAQKRLTVRGSQTVDEGTRHIVYVESQEAA